MQKIFVLQDNSILLFLDLESLISLFVLHELSYVLKYKLEVFLFFSIQNIKSNSRTIFSQTFSIHLILTDNLFLHNYIYL